MSEIPAVTRSKIRWIAICLLVLGLGAGTFFGVRSWRERSVPTATPELAIRSLSASSLYFNGAARPWLLRWRPELLTEEDRDEISTRARAMVQAVQNPKLFRQLDRAHHFDALLLVGDPSQFRPLVEHLVETNDWKLAYLDHTSLVFRRDAVEWKVAALDSLAGTFKNQRERAAFLAQSAVRLLALRRAPEAQACLEKAQALDDRLPEIWNAQAILRMNRGEWAPALTNANRALKLDPDFLPALATKTQILFSTKKFSDAYALSRKLVEAHPDDPGLLFYHAKISHEAHAYTDEIRSLRRLIELAEAESRPTTGYRLYLGAAYAKEGRAQPAIDEFTRALADTDLPADQRRFAEETVAQIKDRTGIR